MHNRTLLFGIILLKHGHHFDYWNQPLNMRMRVCYLDCHEVGLSCYLEKNIENLLRTLQLFYFHLWINYWLYLIYTLKYRGLEVYSLLVWLCNLACHIKENTDWE
jgi:hypothetical protein